jgi:hypothetical protein
MAIETVDILLSSEITLDIAFVSISREREDCFKITISTTVSYVEHRQTYADIFPIPLESIVNYDTDPEVYYTKNWVVEHVWGESIHDTIYTALVTDIQTDINGYMKERYLTDAAAAPILALDNNVSFDPNWTP